MKLVKYVLAALLPVAVSCADNIPEPGEGGNTNVEQIVLDETLSGGLEIIVGQTFSLPEHVSVLPEDATNTAQRYESSDPETADVSEQGVLTAKKEGECTITIYVGMEGVCADFDVTVLPVPEIPLSGIEWVAMNAEYQFFEGMILTVDLTKKVAVTPSESSEKVVFTSSEPTVASIDENGLLTVHKTGETTLTATAAEHPAVTASHTLKVVPLENIEYDRSAWTMTCSQTLRAVSGRNNSLTAMFDGRQIVNRAGAGNVDDAALTNGTAFCIDVPGRNQLDNLKTDEEKAAHEIYFIIDLKQPLLINWFRISNISESKDDMVVRYKGFTEISGSNDGETFELIEQNFDFTDKNSIKISETPSYNRATENICIKTSTYRYLKFMMRGLSCYGPLGKTGGTAQIEEFYLGYDKNLVADPEPEVIPVESIELSEELASGLELFVDAEKNVSSFVTVLPADAADKSVSFTSAAPEVATVTPEGLVKAVAEGDAVITVTASNGVTTTFNVVVKPAPAVEVDITSLAFSSEVTEYDFNELSGAVNLNSLLTVLPSDNTEGIVFETSDADVASVDENGMMTLKKLSEGVTVTVRAAKHPEVCATMTVKVYKYADVDYPRYTEENGERTYLMTMTASQEVQTVGGRNNSLTAMLDGRQIVARAGTASKDDEALTNGTAYCVHVPGRNSLSNLKTDEEKAAHEIYFIIDLKEARPVNYFRISNISTNKDDMVVRYKGFTEISGSNDGETFTTIETDYDFAAQNSVKISETPTYNRETENLTIKASEYRYLKFMMRGLSCYGPLGKTGGTAQIEEFYLGRTTKVYTE